MSAKLNILAIVQGGRLQYEALIFAASLNATSGDTCTLWLAEPQPGPEWQSDPRIDDPDIRAMLQELGANIIPFSAHDFGSDYIYGNKIVAPLALPEGEPFAFFDTDTLFLAPLSDVPFDFNRPTASLNREDTWPKPDMAGYSREQIWAALYRRFDLDFEASQDRAFPPGDWRRYLYFNAGFFHYRCPRIFAKKFREIALSVRDNPPPELKGQPLHPWLDQIALPLAIHALGGSRDALPPGFIDATTTCHYRCLPLLYARQPRPTIDFLQILTRPNRLKKLLKRHEPFRRYLYQGWGARARALFENQPEPASEAGYRKPLKAAGLWLR